jgi:hypothetical protein
MNCRPDGAKRNPGKLSRMLLYRRNLLQGDWIDGPRMALRSLRATAAIRLRPLQIQSTGEL